MLSITDKKRDKTSFIETGYLNIETYRTVRGAFYE